MTAPIPARHPEEVYADKLAESQRWLDNARGGGAETLSDKELAEWRAAVKDGATWTAGTSIPRLLATLDARVAEARALGAADAERRIDPGLALSLADTLATMLEHAPRQCDPDPEGGTCIAHNAEWSENAGCEWIDGLQAIDLYRAEARAVRAAIESAEEERTPEDERAEHNDRVRRTLAFAQSVVDLDRRESAEEDRTHVHEWIDARNEVVTSGEMCLCGAIRENPDARQ